VEYGSLLLLFDEKNPCWTEKLAELAGENPVLLADMVRDGLAERKGEVCVLTGEGRTAFQKEAAERYLSAQPGIPGPDLGKHLFGTRLRSAARQEAYPAVGAERVRAGSPFSRS
jgi:hypothetical protein